MRQFVIYHRRGRRPWRRLQSGFHDDLCARPEVQRNPLPARRPSIEGIAVRVHPKLFNLMIAAPTNPFGFTFPFPEG